MANYTGANVCDVVEIETYQPDAFSFGIASNDSKVSYYITQTTNDIFRQLRIEWWPVYKTNVFTDITVLNTAEMVNTKVNLDQFTRAGVYLFYQDIFYHHYLSLDLRQKKIDLKEWLNTMLQNITKNGEQF